MNNKEILKNPTFFDKIFKQYQISLRNFMLKSLPKTCKNTE